jgi:flagella basal body P-ring formation protein FlgA
MVTNKQLATAVIALVATAVAALVTSGPVQAEPLADTIRARVELSLPAGLGVADVHLPAQLAHVDVDPQTVAIEVPRDLRAGRPSIKVTTHGRAAWVPVLIAPVVDVAIARSTMVAGHTITAGDIAIERRAIGDGAPASRAIGATLIRDLDAGSAIGEHDMVVAAPLARGTEVTVDVRRGGLRIRGTGVLEVAARIGEPATVRLEATKTLLHGTLVAPSTLVIGDAP